MHIRRRNHLQSNHDKLLTQPNSLRQPGGGGRRGHPTATHSSTNQKALIIKSHTHTPLQKPALVIAGYGAESSSHVDAYSTLFLSTYRNLMMGGWKLLHTSHCRSFLLKIPTAERVPRRIHVLLTLSLCLQSSTSTRQHVSFWCTQEAHSQHWGQHPSPPITS